ncbi:MAG TPA: flagellar hook-length control protein FliK [Roseateles sp.]|nr:flagellar hook-length control protein FliK [Roseateles sp.]
MLANSAAPGSPPVAAAKAPSGGPLRGFFAEALQAEQGAVLGDGAAQPFAQAEPELAPDVAPAPPAVPVVAADDEFAADPGAAPVDPQSAYAMAALGLLQALPQRAMGGPTLAPVPDEASPAAALPALAPALAWPDGAAPRPAFQAAAVVDQGPAEPLAADAMPTAPTAPAAPLAAADLAPAPALEGGDAPAAVALKGEPRQWQQPLLQALGDRLQLQISARSEQAVIRLDPPLLGRVEIAIRQQAGELQVRIAASHGEVARQVQQVSEQLRQDLVQRHSGEVSVQVLQPASAGRETDARGAPRDAQQQQAQQQAQEQREQQRRPGRALGDEDPAAFVSTFTAATT